VTGGAGQQARTYRLAPADRSGVVFGLSAARVATLAVGLVGAVLAFSKGAPAVGIAVAAVCVGLVAVRADGGPLVETLPSRLGWMGRQATGRHRWWAPLPLADDPETAGWPPALDGQVLLGIGAAEHRLPGAGEMGVVWDRRAGTVSATVALFGGHFGLVDRADQDAAVAQWGAALAGFVRDRSPVVQLRWSEWAAPAPISEHLGFLERACHDPASPAAVSYKELVEGAGRLATRHETLVTVTVAVGRAPRAVRAGRDARAAAIAVLAGELRLFIERLTAGGLRTSPPLSVGELARAVRSRLDPTCLAGLDRRSASLGRAAGLVRPANSTPLATEAAWTYWRADSSVHRCFYIADWPRLDVPANWMSPLLVWDQAVRSVTVIAEPVSPRASADAIRRQATRLESDQVHRASQGFRVGAGLRRAAEAVNEREEELVSGYRELTYAGIIAITTPSTELLERSSEDICQKAGEQGLELRPLHGRHDQALAVCLPLGRGLAPPRRWGSR
jgi:hypothetical protein